MPEKSIKKVKIVKRQKKRKIKINKLSKRKSKGGKCSLNHKQQRGGAMCVGEKLHRCLKRETDRNNIRAKPQNGSSKNYTLHGKYPRFPINQNKAVGDMGRVNKRSLRHEKRIVQGKFIGGAKKKKGGQAKKGQYTKPGYKRVKAATPEFAKKHGEVAKGGAKRGRPKKEKSLKKGGASGYKKAKNRVARIGRKAIKPKLLKKKKSLKKKKGGASGYKKSKNRQARIDSKQSQPRKPIKDNSKFA